MDVIRSLGTQLLQAFQKIPGFVELFDQQSLDQISLILGIVTIICFITGFGLIIAGIVKFAIKKIQNEREGNGQKTSIQFLIGGIVGGAILILIPGIIWIVGSILGQMTIQ